MCSSTIAAISTPIGYSGIGIVRVSGSEVDKIISYVIRKSLKSRVATYSCFYDVTGSIIDYGIAIYYKKPHTFTGEDLLELHCHGNPFILNNVLTLVLRYGAVEATPGEFSLRAFMNKKIDLVQAESIYGLIESSSTVKNTDTLSSLKGNFSNKLNAILYEFFDLRMLIEATINFEISSILNNFEYKLKDFLYGINLLLIESTFFQVPKGYTNVVIVGKPNAGKSSLFNVLLNGEYSIVTNFPGTTRDSLECDFIIDGLLVNLIDTAGLNYNTTNFIEIKGIEVSKDKIKKADLVILVVDGSVDTIYEPSKFFYDWDFLITKITRVLVVINKVDLLSLEVLTELEKKYPDCIFISSKTLFGVKALKKKITQSLYVLNTSYKNFRIHSRNVDSLLKIRLHVERCFIYLKNSYSIDYLAEELRLIQLEIMKISGKSYDDIVLDRIFSRFCVGK